MPKTQTKTDYVCAAAGARQFSQRMGVKIFRSASVASPETEKLAHERKENQCGAPSAKSAFFVLLLRKTQEQRIFTYLEPAEGKLKRTMFVKQAMPQIPLTPFFKGGICKRILGFFNMSCMRSRLKRTMCVKKTMSAGYACVNLLSLNTKGRSMQRSCIS